MAFVNLIAVAASFTAPHGSKVFSVPKHIAISSAREEDRIRSQRPRVCLLLPTKAVSSSATETGPVC